MTTSQAPAPAGAITLARHGKPALSRKCLLSAEEYRDWWARYEVGGLQDGQTPPDALIQTASNASTIYASTRRRAQETAAAVAGARQVVSDPLFIEAPLPPPPFPSWFKLPPRYWGVVSRFFWHILNAHQGQESRDEAEIRAEKAAQLLIAQAGTGQEVLVLAHGYFNFMVGRRLEASGWRLVRNQGFRYWSQRRYEQR
jgi:broad specificity phosphatase PhoE